MAVAWILAFLTVLTKPAAGDYSSYGPELNWVLGLPCWLLGCRLAERMESFETVAVGSGQIWIWRASAWALSTAICLLRFHTPHIGYPWTLNLFALFACASLEREIRYYREHK
jgi:hypothetical protein